MSRAPRPADWVPPGLAQDQLVTLKLGVCDFLPIVVKKGVHMKLGFSGRRTDPRERRSHFFLPGGSQEGLNQQCCFCERRKSSAGSAPAAAGFRKGPDLEKGFPDRDALAACRLLPS